VGERLMTLGIERPALGVVDRDALGFEDRQQLAPGQLGGRRGCRSARD